MEAMEYEAPVSTTPAPALTLPRQTTAEGRLGQGALQRALNFIRQHPALKF